MLNSVIESPKYALGIDLGNVTTCAAVWHEDRIQIIPNLYGDRITPSFVTFTDQECIVGNAAKEMMLKDDNANTTTTTTLFNIIRLIGRKFDDVYFQAEVKSLPFAVEKGCENKPLFLIRHKGGIKRFYAEQIAALIISQVKQDAEIYIRKSIKEAVLSVPALFNDSQRQAIKDAGKIAGLNVLRIMNSSLCSALAYGFGRKNTQERIILVLNLGSCAFDASVVSTEDGIYEIKATVGNTRFGGQEFDTKMIEYCLENIKSKTGVDISEDLDLMRKVRNKCETAKIELTKFTETTIEIEVPGKTEAQRCHITRNKFEDLCSPLFAQIMQFFEQVLKDSRVTKDQIADFVLAGGSSKIPKLQELLIEYFNGKEPSRSINPDEAVSYGAAIQAAVLSESGSKIQEIQDVLCIDATTISLGIACAGGVMTVLIPKNTSIPTKKTQIFSTYADNQPVICVEIYEGERALAKDNNTLAKFLLKEICPAPRGAPQIEVTFDIDANGVFNLSACDKLHGKSCWIIVVAEGRGRLPVSEIERCIEEGKEYKADMSEQKKIQMKNKLIEYCNTVKTVVKETWIVGKVSQNDIKELEEICDYTIDWAGDSSNEIDQYTVKEYNIQQRFNLLLKG